MEWVDVTKRIDVMASRRALLRAGVAVLGGVGAAVAATQARAQEKIAPAMVQYQTQPKKDDDGKILKCSECVNFEAPAACKIVAGTISPDGWCIAFAPKES